MGDKLTYSHSSNTVNPVSNGYNPRTERYITDLFSKISGSKIEELPIYLLSVLFMMSGLLLFICGLFLMQLYQFIMGFVFLTSGFVLDNINKPDKAGK
jgi:hypothetical protein